MVRRVPRRTDVGRTAQMRLTLEPFVSDAMREPCESYPTLRSSQHRALCRLRRQFRWIPELSFLPQSQGYRRDLPRQGQERHVGVDTMSEGLLVEVLEGTVFVSDGRGRALEHILEDPVVIAIQPACQRRSPTPANRAGHDLFVGTRVRNHTQA